LNIKNPKFEAMTKIQNEYLLPLLYPPLPSGRGRIKVGEGVLNFEFWSFGFACPPKFYFVKFRRVNNL